MKDNKEKPELELTEEIKTLRNEIIDKELNNSEKRFKILFDYAPDGYYINDLEGNFIDGNKAAEQITGYNKEELIGKNYFQVDLLTKKDIIKVIGALKKNRKGLPTGPDEYILKRKNGKKIEVEITTYPIKIKGRIFVLGIARDIRKRKKTERALVESEEKFRTLINQAPEALSMHDMEGNIIEVNKAMISSYGYSKEELLKLKIKDIYPDSFKRDALEIQWRKLKENQIKHFNSFHKRKNGTVFPVRVSLSAITLGDQKYFLGLAEDITDLMVSQHKVEKIMNAIIETISKIVDTRDPYTAGHQHRVYQLSSRIALELHLPQENIEAVRIASLIHDIGKIGIPSEILTKPTALSAIEFSLIKEHSQLGYNILKDVTFPYPIAQIILQHHERNDGSGYPYHLKGNEILLESKIIGVADVVESMCSHRPYRAALGIKAALEEISKNSGILYEQKIVDVCLKLFREKGFRFE